MEGWNRLGPFFQAIDKGKYNKITSVRPKQFFNSVHVNDFYIQSGFLRSEIVSNQTGNQIPDEIVETSVTGMLNLATVF